MERDKGYGFIRACLLAPLRGLYNPEIHNRENLLEPSAIFASNHKSYLDPFLIIASMPFSTPINFIARDFRDFGKGKSNDFVNRFYDFAHQIKIRGKIGKESRKELFENAEEVFESENYLGIFPEGQRIRKKGIGRFDTGAADISLEFGRPIIPVYLKGTDYIWHRDSTLPRLDGKADIYIGNPVFPSGTNVGRNRKEITDLIRNEIVGMREKYG